MDDQKAQTPSADVAEASPMAESSPMEGVGLKLLVIFLGVLLLVVACTFFILLFTRGAATSAAEAGPTATEISAALGEGEAVVETTLSRDAVALRIDGPAGERVEVYDLDDGALRAVVRLSPAPE